MKEEEKKEKREEANEEEHTTVSCVVQYTSRSYKHRAHPKILLLCLRNDSSSRDPPVNLL